MQPHISRYRDFLDAPIPATAVGTPCLNLRVDENALIERVRAILCCADDCGQSGQIRRRFGEVRKLRRLRVGVRRNPSGNGTNLTTNPPLLGESERSLLVPRVTPDEANVLIYRRSQAVER